MFTESNHPLGGCQRPDLAEGKRMPFRRSRPEGAPSLGSGSTTEISHRDISSAQDDDEGGVCLKNDKPEFIGTFYSFFEVQKLFYKKKFLQKTKIKDPGWGLFIWCTYRGAPCGVLHIRMLI